MTDDNLDELLASVDSTSEPPPDARARVWDRVRNDLSDLTDDPIRPPDPEPPAEATVIDLAQQRRVARHPRRWLLTAVAATVAVIAIGGLVIGQSQPDGRTVETDQPARQPPSLPVLTDPTLACERYVEAAGPLLVLEDSITDDRGTAPDLATAIAALDQLIIDVTSSDSVDATLVGDLEQIRGGLSQAQAHLETDDPDSATAAFDFVEATYRNSALFDTTCLG